VRLAGSVFCVSLRCLSPIFGLEVGYAIEFSLVGCDHDQLVGAGGGGNQNVVGADRLALGFEEGPDFGGLVGFGPGEGENGDGIEELGDRRFNLLGALRIERKAVTQFHDGDDGYGDIGGWGLFESGLGAWFIFDEVADDAGIEQVAH
jgi:hypothetical protein